MKNNLQALNLLGLAQRARKLTTGTPQVLAAIRTHQAQLVVLAADAGAATNKKITDKCQSYNISYTTKFTRAQISGAIGQNRSIVAVCDAGFAAKLTNLVK